MFSLLRPYIFGLDPEVAHDLAIKSLKFNVIPKSFFQVDGEQVLETELFKRKLKNPIGLAAGFDKSAEVYNSLFKLGFGFVEVGTITPRRQTGNLKPRIFRLEKDKAMINRLGFNNDGMDIVSERISKSPPEDFLGINVGPNKDTKDKASDFIKCFDKLNKLASYITINISSPNTDGLRDFHEEKLLSDLLTKLNKLKKDKKIKCPVVIKISPDMADKEIFNVNEIISKFKIDGIILTNTTNKHRENLSDSKKNETGGLSGSPLRKLSLKLIKQFFKLSKGKIPIIGVGGVDSGQSAFEKITAGATAVQLYTGMVYNGPGVVKDIKKELIEILKKEKIKNIREAIGINS
ncbi:quinone-dependent dihydroorotate dehydrogenase [Pelagibacteraceae bacterium]|jgi:dihydroorotate dehydrogenase|nr:quinone-dependent dihydroorotate dehydrogenase [Pelagibacteraceae bacterium]